MEHIDHEELVILHETLKICNRNLARLNKKVQHAGGEGHAAVSDLNDIEDVEKQIYKIREKLFLTMSCPECQKIGKVQVIDTGTETKWVVFGFAKKTTYHIVFHCYNCNKEFTIKANRANPWKYIELLLPTGGILVGATAVNTYLSRRNASQVMTLVSHQIGYDLLDAHDSDYNHSHAEWGMDSHGHLIEANGAEHDSGEYSS